MSESDRPLVTFALFAYNQDKYIREAVRGALEQDYSPLEIILSDDFSNDRTYEIMQDMAEKYSGPHSIRLNRNTKTLGIAEHLNFMMTLVRSNFVVVAAGDDISFANRTNKLVSAWLESGRQLLSIHSYAEDMDEHGNLTGNLRRGSENSMLSNPMNHARNNIGVLGATHAWEMSLIHKFPPILKSVVNEDLIIPARASLVGKVGFVSEVLVKYRIGVGVTHEVSRRRAAGMNDQSVSIMKRQYYPFLQKFRDYRECGVLSNYRSHFRKARAVALFPIWLRVGRRSTRNVALFLRRCPTQYLVWEIIKFNFPGLVAAKQRIQFWLAGRVQSLRARRFPADR